MLINVQRLVALKNVTGLTKSSARCYTGSTNIRKGKTSWLSLFFGQNMNKREPIAKKLRFTVFKRDSFCCQYCGATPPGQVIEVDHINPVVNGGKNTIDNLITACFDCNRGKGAGLLSSLPESILEKSAILAEKIDQLKAFERLIKSQKKHEENDIDRIQDAFKIYHPTKNFTEKFRESIRVFLKELPCHSIIEFIKIACVRINRDEDALKYFCGICWKTIRDTKNGKN
jgi:hypothetical protein